MLVAYAVVHGEPPEVYPAEDIDVLSRVVALHLVAATPAGRRNEGRALQAAEQASFEFRVSPLFDET